MTHWRVHLGAHKTGTTHVQALLHEYRDELAAKGITYVPFEVSHRLLRFRNNPPSAKLRLKRALGLAPDRAAKIRALAEGRPTGIISDEDLLGLPQNLLDTPIYGDSRRLRLVDSLPDCESLALFLSIRNYGTLYASVFADVLKAFPDARRRFDDFRGRAASSRPQWTGLVAAIRAEFPQAALHVWTFEDHVAQPRFTLEALTGTPVDRFVDVPPPVNTRSPSRRGIELAEAVDPGLPFRERRRRVEEIYFNHPKQAGEDLGLFSAEDLAAFDRAYAEDLEAIAGIEGVRLLRPSQVTTAA